MPFTINPLWKDSHRDALAAGQFDLTGVWLETEDGQRLPLRGACRLGRAPDNHLILEGDKASRQHAVIHGQDDDEYWLLDLASRNGTHLHGQRLLRPTRLRDGDRFTIAGNAFRFRQPAAAAGESTTYHASGSSTGGSATMVEYSERPAWLLMADMEAFTRQSHELPAEQLALRINPWFDTGRRLIRRHGGRISKYLGDGFLACWEDTAASTAGLLAALHDLRALRDTGPIRFRVVVHHGRLLFGGSTEYGEETMIGPEMNFIFRLEDLASRLQIAFCASDPAQALLAAHLPTEPVPGDFELKGVPGRHRCHALPSLG